MSYYIDFFQNLEKNNNNPPPSPSVVDIYIPTSSGNREVLRGILANEVSIGLKNSFGNALPQLDQLVDVFQLMSLPSIPAWIGASTQVWKGTDLLRLALEFYLIHYKPGLNHEKGLKALAKLATFMEENVDADYKGPGSSIIENVRGRFMSKVHGGYRPDPFKSNEKQFLSFSQLSTLAGVGVDNGIERDIPGTIRIKIGKNFSLGNLLLTKIDITPSVVEVGNESKSKPLYYKVLINLQTTRAAVETDVDSMFGGGL